MMSKTDMAELWRSVKFSFSFEIPAKPTRKQLDLFYRCFRFVLDDDMVKARELGWKRLLITVTVVGAMLTAYLLLKYYVFFGSPF